MASTSSSNSDFTNCQSSHCFWHCLSISLSRIALLGSPCRSENSVPSEGHDRYCLGAIPCMYRQSSCAQVVALAALGALRPPKMHVRVTGTWFWSETVALQHHPQSSFHAVTISQFSRYVLGWHIWNKYHATIGFATHSVWKSAISTNPETYDSNVPPPQGRETRRLRSTTPSSVTMRCLCWSL